MIFINILRNIILLIYIVVFIIKFATYRSIFGKKNSNILLSNLVKPAIIPVLRFYGAQIGKNTVIEPGIIIHNAKNFKNLIIGNNCYVGNNCFIDLKGNLIIENNVTISMNCTFINHIDIGNSKLKKIYPNRIFNINIKENVYIGSNSTVFSEVTVGESSIVGAMSLVNKDIVNGTLNYGIPSANIKNISIE